MNETNDPLAIYRIAKKGVNTPLNPDLFPDDESESDNPIDKYRIKPIEQHESMIKDLPRKAAGLAARGAEAAIGAPEETKKGISTILDYVIGVPTEYLTGKKHPKFRQFLRDPTSIYTPEQLETIKDFEKEHGQVGEANLFQEMPTSQEVKENITKPASKDILGNENALEPKSETERFGQEFTQDLVRLSLPGSGAHTWTGKVGLAFAGNSTKEIAKLYGFSPSTQELVKFGTLGILSLAQIGNAPQFARELFQNSKKILPRGIAFKTGPLENLLNKVKNSDWYKGHSTPSTGAAREMIEAIESRINNGTLNAHQAMKLRENINEYRGNLGAFKVDRSGKNTHIAHLDEVQNALIKGMEETLGKQYPNWWKQYQGANQAYAITQRSSAIGNLIANNYAKPLVS